MVKQRLKLSLLRLCCLRHTCITQCIGRHLYC